MSEQHEQSNGIDPVTAKRFVGEIDRCAEELLTLRGEYMQRCKAVRERVKDWKEQAEAAGIPRRGLTYLLRHRDLEAKLKEHEQEAEPDVVESADMIREALGDYADLPLGKATVEASSAPKPKRGRPKKGAPLVGEDTGAPPRIGADDDADLRSTRQREQEATRQAEAEERLAGMKTLDEPAVRH